MKFDLGEIAESEVWRAEIQLLQEQQNAQQVKQRFLDSQDTLLVLMGLELETPIRLREFSAGAFDLPELGLGEQETCVREALANRPELLRADISVRQAQINVEVAKNGILPFLDLEGTYSDSEAGRHLSDVNDLNDSRRWSFGALFDLPLPNMANREALRRAKIRLEQAQISRRSLERDINQEVRQFYRALETNRVRVEILKRNVELGERSLQMENARFFWGENTSLDVRNAQDDLFAARRRYNNARLSYHSDLASLYRAIGRQLYREPARESLPDIQQN
jgi:OMF family outer membrane factor